MTNNRLKILFIGEYSGVFTQLINNLKTRQIFCFIVSNGDHYKKFPSDYFISNDKNYNKSIIVKIYRNIKWRLGINGLLTLYKHWEFIKKNLTGFDIVQLINPVPLSGFGSIPNLLLIRFIRKNNKNIFLSSLGDDYYVVEWLGKNYPRSTFYTDNNFLKNLVKPKNVFGYKYCLFYKYLNDYVIKHSKKIIPGLLCYKIPYDWTKKTTNVIPFPVDSNLLGKPLKINKKNKIVIFHGWQNGKESRKGNDIFDRVIKRVLLKYQEKIKYVVVKSIPYKDYIELFSDSHIFIDQLYADDKGVNGLIGMAAGKVVFSGFEKKALEAYPNYNGELIGIDSFNDEEYLYNKFCELIDNPKLIEDISYNAIEFVKKNHLSQFVVDLYIKEWKKYLNE